MTHPSSAKIAGFRRIIWNHYRRSGRRLPWRKTRDPYRILVSEMMLQQTQVERVMPTYALFLRRFPDFAALAQAPLADVLREWQGLGYNRRARYLWQTARIIYARDHHDPSLVPSVGTKLGSELGSKARIPSNPMQLAALPGIGPSTAGAVAAFAFQKPIAFIETNIRRVFIHFFFPRRKSVSDTEIMLLIEKTLNRKNPREWYYALMDYGAYLVKQRDNPNRRSRHYAVQPRFEGSRRQLRGNILRAILADPSLTISALAKKIALPIVKVKSTYRALQKEGLIA